MLEPVPLQVIDNFLLSYHFGHVFVLLLALSVVGVLPTRSMRAVALNLAVFGLLFLLTPIGMFDGNVFYKLLGVPLIVVAPLLFTMGEG